MNAINLVVKKLRPTAKLPTYGSEHAAGLDFYASTVEVFPYKSLVVVNTGLALAIPEGHYLALYSRSGIAFKEGFQLVNGTGVIDADYRGELKIGFTTHTRNMGDMATFFQPGMKVAQGVILPYPKVHVSDCGDKTLPVTLRGDGGFGSTGAS